MRTEFNIEMDILTWLNLQPGVFAFKVETRGFYDEARGFYRRNRNRFVLKGTSDIIGIYQGKFLAIEVKTPTNQKRFFKKKTEHELNQHAFLDKVTQSGGLAFCASSLDEVVSFFKSIQVKNDTVV
jgi:penicillin-binding protein-related factor A (putative recombinase)